jgi:hypothetical protein
VVEIQVPLQPKQAEGYRLAEETKHVVIGWGGSRGSAKSHGLRSVMLLRRLKYPGTAGLIFRRKWKQIRSNHLENGYFKQFPFMRAWWEESKRTLRLPNGSRIVFGVAEHEGDINDYQGDEYMDVMLDEATRLSEQELQKMNVCRRWTGKLGGNHIPDWLCKTFYGMNPGGPGHNYIRRVMYKKDYHGKEKAEHYAFLQCFAWDNVEWARAALAEDGLSEKDYYSWTDEQRFSFFVSRTQYGQELDSLPQRLRVGWLLGNWDEFAGQFYDIWDPDRFVRRCLPDKNWHPRWLGIDWGFQHPCSCHWLARVGKKTSIYREHINNLHSVRAQAQEIVDKTPIDERKLLDAIYLSPDAFQKRSEQDSFADLMSEVFRRYGMPECTPADDDRVHGAQCMYDLMKYDELEIDPSCKGLIETIPMVCTEEDDPEEIEKFAGDDAWDSARYGLKSRERPATAPAAERAQERVVQYALARKKLPEDLDPNTLACLTRRAIHLERRKIFKRRGGLGPVWRAQPTGRGWVQ